MRRFFLLFGLAAITAWIAPRAAAQDRPVRGVVWAPPSDVRQAAREVRDMHARGVQAIRTPVVDDERLLTLADTLGVQFYQDLPIAYLSARALIDTLGFARLQLERTLARARRHPSARHFGLATNSDTSVPAACASLRELAELVRAQGPPGSRAYYVTPFVDTEQCADAVDDVLLDVRNASPHEQLAAWHAAHPDGPVGLGALGTWVRRDGLRGVQVPHAPEAQARYFERHLNRLLADTARVSPSAVFVYRWRDAMDSDPYGRAYGLHTADGTARPAAEVVGGVYTGTQTVFAFPSGASPRSGGPWLILMGWGFVAALSFIYFREPRFRHTLLRYFGAHRFYQEAVAEGREVLVGSSMTLLGGAVLGIGTLGVVIGRCFQDAPAVLWAIAALPASLRPGLVPLLAQPWSLGVVLAAGYVVSLVGWVALLVLVGRYRAPITAGQAVMIVGWPRWPMLLVLVATLVVSSMSPEAGRSLVPPLLVAAGTLSIWMTGRTLFDFGVITKVPAVLAVITVLGSPLSFLFGVGTLLIARHGVSVTFLWHLFTRT